MPADAVGPVVPRLIPILISACADETTVIATAMATINLIGTCIEDILLRLTRRGTRLEAVALFDFTLSQSRDQNACSSDRSKSRRSNRADGRSSNRRQFLPGPNFAGRPCRWFRSAK